MPDNLGMNLSKQEMKVKCMLLSTSVWTWKESAFKSVLSVWDCNTEDSSESIVTLWFMIQKAEITQPSTENAGIPEVSKGFSDNLFLSPPVEKPTAYCDLQGWSRSFSFFQAHCYWCSNNRSFKALRDCANWIEWYGLPLVHKCKGKAEGFIFKTGDIDPVTMFHYSDFISIRYSDYIYISRWSWWILVHCEWHSFLLCYCWSPAYWLVREQTRSRSELIIPINLLQMFKVILGFDKINWILTGWDFKRLF